jgi:hypothetical protein
MARSFRSACVLLGVLVLSMTGHSRADEIPLAPIVQHGFQRVTTHEELLTYLGQIARSCRAIRIDTIGTTTQGRVMPMAVIANGGRATRKLRVLVFCSQHGNEPSGKEAALIILERIARGEYRELLKGMDLWLVPSMNPDGNELQQRWNGAGKDLNRDHLILMQPETRALHAVYDRILPDATLDVHEFQTSGKAWEDAGFFRAMDEQWGAPTNPNVDVWLRRYGVETMFPAVRSGLEADGFRFYNYTIVGSPQDTMRHSTTNVNDGRQSLASQGSYSFILEGRNGKTFHEELERRTKGQLSALTHFLGFVTGHAAPIREKVQAARAAIPAGRDSIVLLAEYLFNGESMLMPVRTIAGGRDSVIRVLHRSMPTPLLRTARPAAYVVPATRQELIALMQRHEVTMRTLRRTERLQVEVQTVQRWNKRIFEEDETLFPEITRTTIWREFTAGDVVIPMDQRKAFLISLALEPASVWGVVQYEPFAALRVEGTEFPVYRLLPRH